MHIHSNNAAKQNLPAGMAVGTNTYARTGSIQMGDHTLEKNQIAIGDTTADKLRQFAWRPPHWARIPIPAAVLPRPLAATMYSPASMKRKILGYTRQLN